MSNIKFNRINQDEVLRLNSNQLTIKQISIELGTTEYIIEKILKQHGLKGKLNGTKIDRLKEKYQDIIKSYDKHNMLSVVAKEFNTTKALINKILKSHNIKKINAVKELNSDEVIEYYKKVRRVKLVSEKFGVSNSVILKLLHSNNVRVSIIKFTEEEIVKKYYELKNITAVSRDLKINEKYISDVLFRNNVTLKANKRVSIGEVYGMLKVQDYYVHTTSGGYATKRFICKCECGGKRTVIANDLLSTKNPIIDCGCIFKNKREIKRKEKEIKKKLWLEKMEAAKLKQMDRELKKALTPKKYLPGYKNNKLTILSITGKGNDKKYLCKCDCGNIKEVNNKSIYMIKSCGCLREERRREASTIHNQTSKKDMSRRRWYDRWKGMVARCYNTKSPAYNNYGGRGIRVCDRWLEPKGVGSANYYNDIHEYLGKQPSPDHSLDRIDNDGMYEITNLRWATNSQQAKNQRRFLKK